MEKIFQYSFQALNVGIAGDKAQNILRRVNNLHFSFNSHLKYIFILCSTNNIDHNSPRSIASTIVSTGLEFQKKSHEFQVVVIPLLPRDHKHSRRRGIINTVNKFLKFQCLNNGFYFLEFKSNWLNNDSPQYMFLQIQFSQHFILIQLGHCSYLWKIMSLTYLIIEFIHIFQNGATFNKMTFSNINLSKKALLILVLVFLKVKIRKALRCNITSLEDLLKLNNVCHLIRNFSNLSQFYLSLVNFFSIHMKRVSAFLYYTASFILVTAIVFCQSNLFWDCANDLMAIAILVS